QEQEQEQEQSEPTLTDVNNATTEPEPNSLSPEPTGAELLLAENNGKQQQNEIRVWLQDALSRQLVYPPYARRRGWEGSLEVSVEMQPNGDFTVDILTPATRSIFTDAALATLAQINANNDYCCIEETTRLTLTIEFQLN
ncbi:MAG: energy transducer TonB, partial [Saccharospirillum sp.]